MKIPIAMLMGVSAVLVQPVFAAPKDCEELKAEIATKLDAKGVKAYTLTIVPAAEADAAKTVGSCEAGSMRIHYTKD